MNDQPEQRRGIPVGAFMGGGAVVIALIFIVQNTGTGTVTFLFWDFTMATWLLALILFVLGGVSGYFFHWSRVRARRKR